MNEGLMFALVAAALALLYGIMSIKWILGLPTGNDRMREIAAAVQEGASAYLNRQYTTIGIVGVILLVSDFSGAELANRCWFRARRIALRPDRLYRHERLGACQRAHRRSGEGWPQRRAERRLQGRRHHRHAGGRPWSARRRRLLRRAHPGAGRKHGASDARPGGPGLRRLADLHLRPTRRRHLHQGRRRRRRPGGQGRSRHPRGRPAQPGGDRRQRRRQRRRLRRHGRRPVRDLRRDHHRHHAAGRPADHRFTRSGHLSAGAGRFLHHRLHRRHLLRHRTRRRQDHERAVSRSDRVGRAGRDCLLPHHQHGCWAMA